MLRAAMDTPLSMMSVLRLLLLTLRAAARSRATLQLEVLALRHQLQVLQRTRPRRVRLAKADQWLWVVPRASGPDGERRSLSSSQRPSSPGTDRASGCGGLGRAVAAWGDRLCRPTSAR